MTDPVDTALLALQREYLASLPHRLDELKSDILGLGRGVPEAAGLLQTRLHRLAGSGGSFGLADISAVAREGERWLAANPASTDLSNLNSIVDRLAVAVADAGLRIGGAAAGTAPIAPRAQAGRRGSD